MTTNPARPLQNRSSVLRNFTKFAWTARPIAMMSQLDDANSDAYYVLSLACLNSLRKTYALLELAELGDCLLTQQLSHDSVTAP